MSRLKTARRKVIIGLDGVPFQLIEQLTATGHMPNLRDIINEGVFLEMASSIPEVSSVAWSSIITGTNPGEHGIYGFSELAPGTYRLRFPNFDDLKVPPFWLDEKIGRSVILNVPSTYPARELNGVLIAGFVALDLTKATFPPSIVPKLQEMDYRIDVETEKAHRSMGLFLRHLDATLRSRIAVYRYLWDSEDWQNFVLVFTGTDRLAHFLWDAFEEAEHPYRKAFLAYFSEIDRVIGEIAARLNPQDALIVLSDHGFESLERTLHVNQFLKDLGFLRLRNDPPKSFNDMGYDTTAFALDPARIYIHTEGRYPRGSVREGDRRSVIRDLTEAFESWEVNGRRVVDQILHGKDIYQGPCLKAAPDLVLISKSGLGLRGSLAVTNVAEERVFTGKHTHHDAFLVVRGLVETDLPISPSVSDVLGVFKAL